MNYCVDTGKCLLPNNFGSHFDINISMLAHLGVQLVNFLMGMQLALDRLAVIIFAIALLKNKIVLGLLSSNFG